MKINGDALYNLLRYAYKNGTFDDETNNKEVREVYFELRSRFSDVKKKNLTFEIKLKKIGF